MDQVVGFSLEAGDYVTKPFSVECASTSRIKARSNARFTGAASRARSM